VADHTGLMTFEISIQENQIMPKLIFIFTLVLMLAACNGVGTRKKADGLITAIDEYVAALRWGRFDRAKEYHLDKDGKQPEIDSSQLEYIRVTGHTVKKKTVNEAIDEATVQMEMQYYHNEYGTLKKIIINQQWWFQEEAKSWFLSSDFPKF
jgi:hypothetical protein